MHFNNNGIGGITSRHRRWPAHRVLRRNGDCRSSTSVALFEFILKSLNRISRLLHGLRRHRGPFERAHLLPQVGLIARQISCKFGNLDCHERAKSEQPCYGKSDGGQHRRDPAQPRFTQHLDDRPKDKTE